MVRTLLIRGMLVGVLAGIAVFSFAKLTGEPQVAAAIGVEEKQAQAQGGTPEPEMVSREVQSTVGLLVGTTAFSVAMGGIYALVFAFSLGRISKAKPRALAVLIAAAGFIAVYLVPFLKYPANPPSVGDPDSIGRRTVLYFIMIAVSILITAFSLSLRRSLLHTRGPWNAALIGVAAFCGLVWLAYVAMPGINEVPSAFPATILWRFRVSALGMQLVMWTTLGLAFGALTERESRQRQPLTSAGLTG